MKSRESFGKTIWIRSRRLVKKKRRLVGKMDNIPVPYAAIDQTQEKKDEKKSDADNESGVNKIR